VSIALRGKCHRATEDVKDVYCVALHGNLS